MMPRLRPKEGVLGGVAAGIAEEIGVAPATIRVAFVALSFAGGLGLLAYGLAWLVMSIKPGPDVERTPKGSNRTERLLGLGCLFLGLLVGAKSAGLFFVDELVWPVALLAAGAVVAWDRGLLPEGKAFADSCDRRVVVARVVGGVGLGVVGMVVLFSNLDFGQTGRALLAFLVLLASATFVIGPWLWNLVSELLEERQARVRADERAAVAAHLHDSVLQTLSLIQREADDPAATAQLARRQERELRSWLFGNGETDQLSLRASLEAIVADLEDLHKVPVELVVVGDAELDDRGSAVLAATREAIANAQAHSGAERVDVFAESRDGNLEVFIRDTGIGFDTDAVPEDRHGVSESICGRLERHGGEATITSAQGEGTEVAIVLPAAGAGTTA